MQCSKCGNRIVPWLLVTDARQCAVCGGEMLVPPEMIQEASPSAFGVSVVIPHPADEPAIVEAKT